MSQETFSALGDKAPERFMSLALREAERAFEIDEVPVGAVIVDEPTGRVIAKAHNQREMLRDPTAHAEVLAITQAAAYYRSWRLTDAILYVTLEPCVMCAGAIVQARIPKVVYGALDPKAGAHLSVHQVLAHPANNHMPRVEQGLLASSSAELLREFFRRKRTRPSGGGDDGRDGTRGQGGNGGRLES